MFANFSMLVTCHNFQSFTHCNLLCRGNLEKRLGNLERRLEAGKHIYGSKVFIRRKKRVLNAPQPKRKRSRRTKKNRRKDQPTARPVTPGLDFLDSQGDIFFPTPSQISELSQKNSQVCLTLSPTRTDSPPASQQLGHPASQQLCLSLSPPARLSPMLSLEMPPLTQVSPPPSRQASPLHAGTSPFASIFSAGKLMGRWNLMRDNISAALTAMEGKHSLSREEITNVTGSLHVALRAATKIGQRAAAMFAHME